MKIDRTICDARRACGLPCSRCENAEKCSEKDKEWLKNPTYPVNRPHKTPQRPKNSPQKEVNIPDKIRSYHKRERKNFTAQDIEILNDTKVPARMAAYLTGHHVNSIYRWRRTHGVVLPFTSYGDRFLSNAWTEIELQVLSDTSLTSSQVAEITGRSANAVRLKRCALGIRMGGSK